MEYLLYLFIFLLPLQTRWMIKLGELNGGYWEYGTYSLYAVDILLIGLLVYWFIVGRMQNAECRMQNNLILNTKYLILNTKSWWFVGALELFIFVSVFFAPNKSLAIYGYGRFLLGIGLFFLLTQTKLNKIKLYWSIVAAGAVQSILALQQFLTQSVFGNKWLGMAAQQAQDLGVSVIEAGGERFLRAYGSLPHPNILGGFLAVVLLVNIILYFGLYRKSQYLVCSIKYSAELLLCLVFFIINFTGLLLTFSRSALAGFTVGLLIYLFINLLASKERKAGGVIILLKFIFIIITVGGLFFYFFRGPILGRININSRLENKSITERTNYNNEAWQIIKKHWLFGVGIKNYGLAVYNEINNTLPAYAYQPVHNVFLLVWAETGIFGLLVFIGLLVYLFINLLRNASYGQTVILLAMTVMMCFDHWWWSLAFGGYLFWLIIGVAYKEFYHIKD